MEIDKVAFENLRLLGISQSFEELDVNSDGVINGDDAESAKTDEIKNVINNLINSVDDDVELSDEPLSMQKAGATSDEYKNLGDMYKNNNGIPVVNKANYYDNITNSKGTVYLTIGNNGCSKCQIWQKGVASNLDDISDYAQVYSMRYESDKALSRDLAKQFGATNYIQFPLIIKFVDGKPVEKIPYQSDAATIKNTLISKAENSAKVSDAQETKTDTSSQTLTSSDKTDSTTAVSTQDSTTANTKYDFLYSIQSSYMEQLKSKLEKLQEEQEDIQEENNALRKDMEEKQARYEELVKKINNADENTDVSSWKSEAEGLKSDIAALKLKIESNEFLISNLDAQISANNIAIDALSTTMQNTEKYTTKADKISGVSSTTSTTALTTDTISSTPSTVSTTSSVISADGVDWSALKVDNKGVNINNFVNLLDSNSDKEVSKSEIQNLYDKGSDEQKEVLKKFFDFNDCGKLTSSSEYLKLFSTNSTFHYDGNESYRPLFEILAFRDKDGDGFLSDFEIEEMKTNINSQVSRNAEGPKMRSNSFGTKTQCMTYVGKYSQLGDSRYGFTQTVVNGKKVYIGYTERRNQYLTITEDEMKVLDNYLDDGNVSNYVGYNKKSSDLQPIWDALGAVRSGNENTLVNSAGVVCKYRANDDCTQCDESFYALYLGIKDMMEGKEVQFNRKNL